MLIIILIELIKIFFLMYDLGNVIFLVFNIYVYRFCKFLVVGFCFLILMMFFIVFIFFFFVWYILILVIVLIFFIM